MESNVTEIVIFCDTQNFTGCIFQDGEEIEGFGICDTSLSRCICDVALGFEGEFCNEPTSIVTIHLLFFAMRATLTLCLFLYALRVNYTCYKFTPPLDISEKDRTSRKKTRKFLMIICSMLCVGLFLLFITHISFIFSAVDPSSLKVHQGRTYFERDYAFVSIKQYELMVALQVVGGFHIIFASLVIVLSWISLLEKIQFFTRSNKYLKSVRRLKVSAKYIIIVNIVFSFLYAVTLHTTMTFIGTSLVSILMLLLITLSRRSYLATLKELKIKDELTTFVKASSKQQIIILSVLCVNLISLAIFGILYASNDSFVLALTITAHFMFLFSINIVALFNILYCSQVLRNLGKVA